MLLARRSLERCSLLVFNVPEYGPSTWQALGWAQGRSLAKYPSRLEMLRAPSGTREPDVGGPGTAMAARGAQGMAAGAVVGRGFLREEVSRWSVRVQVRQGA